MLGAPRLLLPVLLALLCHGEAARILGLFPAPSKSHMIVFSALMRELARRGHQVTVVSCFPNDKPIANYTDIVIHNFMEELMSKESILKSAEDGSIANVMKIWILGLVFTEKALEQPALQKFVHSKDQHFDLIFIEEFMNECFLGFVHKFGAPVISMSSFGGSEWIWDVVGNPSNYAHVPDALLHYTDHMTFLQRLHNTVFLTFIKSARALYYIPKQEAVMRRIFNESNNIPSIPEIQSNTAFLFINQHFGMMYPMPVTPNTAFIGGIHIQKPKPLPKDLQQFLDEAPHGVVYFSLGSNVRSSDLPEEKRRAFLEVFSKLKQRVLWKWETDTLPGQPANVRLGKWMPQNDILAHPNVRLFITHGGLLSTQEAVYHGVPVLGIPLFGDQSSNMVTAEVVGYGLRLEYKDISVASVSSSLERLLSQSSYLETVKRLSAIFRDRPETPLERGVFWTEYVLRHKGAAHMRSAALDLAWYQYYLLDVIGTLALCIVFSILSAYWCMKVALHWIPRAKGGHQAPAKKRN